jgi:hypothetical protein
VSVEYYPGEPAGGQDIPDRSVIVEVFALQALADPMSRDRRLVPLTAEIVEIPPLISRGGQTLHLRGRAPMRREPCIAPFAGRENLPAS